MTAITVVNPSVFISLKVNQEKMPTGIPSDVDEEIEELYLSLYHDKVDTSNKYSLNPTCLLQAEEQARKREIRLMKNREAARECRNKKKEYIKCLENRVAVLENQNKALIEELKSLKELYTGQKN